MKKRNVVFGLTALLFLTVMTGCSSKKKTDTVKSVQSQGVLRVAIADSGNAFSSEQNGTFTGMEPELAGKIAAALGVTVQYLPVEKKALTQTILDGTADMAIGCICPDEGIRMNCGVSNSYGRGYVYLVTGNGNYANMLSAFSGKAVGLSTRLGAGTADLLTGNECTVMNYPDPLAAADALDNGIISGYVCSEQEGEALLEKHKLMVRNISELIPENYAVITKAGDSRFLEGINAVIRESIIAQEAE